MANEIDIIEYLSARKDGDVLVDVRDKLTYEHGTIDGAVNIPLSDIKRLYKLPKDKNIYLFCQTGDESGELAWLLSDAGYCVWNLTGGYRKYVRESIGKNI